MYGAIYGEIREEMVRIATAASGDEPVATCPGWTVADVVRHVTGLADDWLTGNLEVYASPAWTAAQVDRFSALDLPSVIDAWSERSPAFETVLDDVTVAPQVPEEITTVIGRFPATTFAGGVCVDLAQHVFDVASALDIAVGLADERVDSLSRMMLGNIKIMWPLVDGPPLSVSTSGGLDRTLDGTGDAVSVAAPSTDLFRSLGGRRTVDQVLALDWTGSDARCRHAAEHLVVPFFRAPTEPAEPVRGK